MANINTALNIIIGVFTLLVMLNSLQKWNDNNDIQYKKRYIRNSLFICFILLMGYLTWVINSSYGEAMEAVDKLLKIAEKLLDENESEMLALTAVTVSKGFTTVMTAQNTTVILIGLIGLFFLLTKRDK